MCATIGIGKHKIQITIDCALYYIWSLNKTVLSEFRQWFCLYFSNQWAGGNIVGLGWTSSENIVCVLEEGNMVVYSIFGQQLYARIIARVSDVRVP